MSAGTRDGGKPNVGDLNYSPPQGPNSIGHSGPGLGGDSYGVGNQPVCHDHEVGSPGIGGTNHGTCGSQGRH
jgi:hypothetical protein